MGPETYTEAKVNGFYALLNEDGDVRFPPLASEVHTMRNAEGRIVDAYQAASGRYLCGWSCRKLLTTDRVELTRDEPEPPRKADGTPL